MVRIGGMANPKYTAGRFRPKAYAVEEAAFSGRFRRHWIRPDGLTVADQRAVATILADAFGVASPNVVRRGGRLSTDSVANPSTNTLRMGAMAGPAVVCHEFAHLLAPPVDQSEPWHGTRWAAAYVECVLVVLGPSTADQLRRHFVRACVIA